MRKAEDYIRATSAAAVQLGIAPGLATSTTHKPTWATFLPAASHLAAPTSPKKGLNEEHGLVQEIQNQAALGGSSQEAPTSSVQMALFNDTFLALSLREDDALAPKQDADAPTKLTSASADSNQTEKENKMGGQDESAAREEVLEEAHEVSPRAVQVADTSLVSTPGGNDEASLVAVQVTKELLAMPELEDGIDATYRAAA